MKEGVELRLEVREAIKNTLLGPLKEKLGDSIDLVEGGERNRIFTPKITGTTMIMSALQEDKTLQNSVMLVKQISKEEGMEISLNTASYTNARQRIKVESLKAVYKNVVAQGNKQELRWKNRDIYLMDGTYLQLQDTMELRKKYPGQKHHKCPSGLLVGVIHAGSGQLVDFELSDIHKTELELGYQIIQRLPKESVLVADDLYSSVKFLYLAQHHQIDMVTPCKRNRLFKVVKSLGHGDDVVEIAVSARSREGKRMWWEKVDIDYPPSFRVRRIEYHHPKSGQLCVLLTTILDPNISTQDIVLLYTKRWEVELSIRELKTIMDIDIIRSKSEDMVFKELLAAFIGYNLIRQLMNEASLPSFFPSDETLFQKFIALDRSYAVDTLGRRPSPGRYPRLASSSSAP
jgi:hypothetical protein